MRPVTGTAMTVAVLPRETGHLSLLIIITFSRQVLVCDKGTVKPLRITSLLNKGCLPLGR